MRPGEINLKDLIENLKNDRAKLVQDLSELTEKRNKLIKDLDVKELLIRELTKNINEQNII
jgi:peptidoglycan hydrolase CwlO-like protein